MNFIHSKRGFTLTERKAISATRLRSDMSPVGAMERKAGFTLIEILVVIAIFAILALVGTDLFSSVLRGSNKAQVQSEIKQNGQVVLNTIERYVRSSTNAAVSGNKLTLTQRDGESVDFEYVPGCTPPPSCSPNGKITLKIGSGTAEELTNTNIVSGAHVQNAVFSVVSPTPPAVPSATTQVVEIELTLSQGTAAPTRKDFVAVITLKTTVLTRSY